MTASYEQLAELMTDGMSDEMSDYRIVSIGELGDVKIVAQTSSRWRALAIRDLCQDFYVVRGGRRETYCVDHPNSEEWVEWGEDEP